MNVDLLKSPTEDQMEMMMMMNMDRLPDFLDEFSSMEFSGGSCSSTSSGNSTNYGNTNMFHTFSNPNAVSPTISFSNTNPIQEQGVFLSDPSPIPSQKRNSMAAMREMIFRIAAMQPIHIDPESVKPPKRRNVKISKDPQSVAARHRRERISERIRILQRLVPGGTKMDTASMLDEAIHYVKFLKTQVQSLERAAANRPAGLGFPVPVSNENGYLHMTKGYQNNPSQNVQRYADA